MAQKEPLGNLTDIMGAHPRKLQDNIAVWSEMKDLQIKYSCLSLGEGAPNLMPPQFLIDDMLAAMQTSPANN